jgi:hypothetical protein
LRQSFNYSCKLSKPKTLIKLHFFIFLLTGIGLSAQNCDWVVALQSAKRLGNGDPWGIALDKNGNVFIAGQFADTLDLNGHHLISNSGSTDAFFAKYSPQGICLWVKSIGGPVTDLAYGLGVDNSGNTIICGNFQQLVDFDPGPGVANIQAGHNDGAFLAKYDANGNYIWANGISGTFNSSITAAILCLDSTGNSYVTGTFRDTINFDSKGAGYNLYAPPGVDRVFIVKYSPSGAFIWARQLGGNSKNVYITETSIAADAKNHIYLTGSYQGTFDFDPGPDSVIISSSAYGGSFISKFDTAANLTWVKTFSKGLGWGRSLTINDTRICLTGAYSGTVDLDPGPAVHDLTSSSTSYADIILASYDTSGAYQWAHGFGTPNYDNVGYGVVFNKMGSVFLTGYFSDVVDFDPGPGIADAGSPSAKEMLLAEYDMNGNYLNAYGFGNLYASGMGKAICITPAEEIYIGGNFNGSIAFGLPSGGPPYAGTHGLAPFIAKFSFNPTGVTNSIQSGELFNLYPNPNEGHFSVYLREGNIANILEVSDLFGRLVLKEVIGNGTSSIQTNHTDPGIYFVKLNSRPVGKFIISK